MADCSQRRKLLISSSSLSAMGCTSPCWGGLLAMVRLRLATALLLLLVPAFRFRFRLSIRPPPLAVGRDQSRKTRFAFS